MKPLLSLKHEDTQKLVVSVLAVVLVSLAAATISQFVAIEATLISIFVVAALLGMHYFRESLQAQARQSEHVQDLQFLQSQVDFRKPLPYLTGWSASPALASRLHSLILERKPESILELGSGVSTVVMAYAAEKVGSGRIISIDHDAAYAEKTRAELRRHQLDHIATVIHAPLIQIGAAGSGQRWYDISNLGDLDQVELLVVDGPPRGTCKDARLPAFEKLTERLAPGCTVVIDDSNRACELNSVAAWTSAANPLFSEDIPCEKGISVRYLN